MPDFELDVTVQEVDEELKKIIFIVDFHDFLNSSTDENSDSE